MFFSADNLTKGSKSQEKEKNCHGSFVGHCQIFSEHLEEKFNRICSLRAGSLNYFRRLCTFLRPILLAGEAGENNLVSLLAFFQRWETWRVLQTGFDLFQCFFFAIVFKNTKPCASRPIVKNYAKSLDFLIITSTLVSFQPLTSCTPSFIFLNFFYLF